VLVEGDVCEEATAGRAVAALLERFGKVDGLVANAGIMIRKPLRQSSLQQWRRVIDTNLTATFLFARAAEKELNKARASAQIGFGSAPRRWSPRWSRSAAS
jgi:NAD(P)-dependent dehydrogenase (short-subunit alcohol dehydrogenase family)